MKNLKIRHIINPVAVSKISDLFIAQPITFTSIQTAREEAKKIGLHIDVCYTCYNEDDLVAPKIFRDAGKLDRSVLDLKQFNKPRKLPLIQDIIAKALQGEPVDYLIYTNVDIAVKPNFYLKVAEITESGYDAFTINRRTIQKSYNSVTQLPLMYKEVGIEHPGHDCFVFLYNTAINYNLGQGCIGANWIGRILLSNLMAFAKRFKIFQKEFLTFHIGDDRAWKKEEFNDYDLHNEAELVKILQYVLPRCDNNCSNDLKKMLAAHENNQIEHSRVEQSRVHRQFKYDKGVLFGNHYLGRNSTILNSRPVFVVGHPRSGTTLLQSKIMTQKGIISLPETHFFTIVRDKLRIVNDRILPDCLKQIFFTLRMRIPLSVEAEQHLFHLAEKNQLSPKMLFEAIVVDNLYDNYNLNEIRGHQFLEKTPDHVLRLDIIFHFYPEAKVVNIVRHPEQAILSRRENFPGENSWDVTEHIKKWKASIRSAEDTRYKQKVLTIRLEDLVSNEIDVMRRICDFLGLPFDAKALLTAPQVAKLVALPWEHWKSNNTQQLSEKILNRRNRRLNNKERRLLRYIAREELAAYGYAVNSSAIPPNRVLNDLRLFLAENAPTLKRSSKRVFFVGHGFHKKTASSAFFIEFLESAFNVSYYWISPHTKNPNYPITYLGMYDIAFFWQVKPENRIIRHLDAKRIVFIPMYDDTGAYESEQFNQARWKPFEKYSFICFCRILYYQLKSIGLNAFYLQYAPTPSPILSEVKRGSNKPKVLFMYRRSEISWELVRQLIAPSDVVSVHIHNAVDPEQTFISPSAEDIDAYNITISEWLPNKADYEHLIDQHGVFIAPRIFEGIGMSVLDAMAHGLCVVAPNKATANEYIRDEYTGVLYDWESPARLDLADWSAIGNRAKRYLANVAEKFALDLRYLRIFFEHLPPYKQTSPVAQIKSKLQTYRRQPCILLVFPHNPFLRQNGVHARFMALLHYFKKRGIVVDILSHTNFVDKWNVDDFEVKSFVRNVFLNDFTTSRTTGLAFASSSPLPDFAFKSLKKQFDEIINAGHYEFVVMGYVHWARLVIGVDGPIKILMVEDCISINLMQRHGGETKYDLESSLNDESSRFDLFDTTIFISSDELELFKNKCRKTKPVYAPHIIETTPIVVAHKSSYSHDLVFVGSDNPFNIDGIKWFLSDVWSTLSEKITLAIVGSICNHMPEFFEVSLDRNITLLGVVDDLNAIYNKSRVAICPLFEGTGLKIKVVEALAQGLPVVSLPAGLIGIKGNKGGCLEAVNAKEFKKGINLLLSSPIKYQEYSDAARATVLLQFSKNVVYSALDGVFLQRNLESKRY